MKLPVAVHVVMAACARPRSHVEALVPIIIGAIHQAGKPLKAERLSVKLSR